MKEHPILMSAPMALATLALRKSQTRRVVNPQPTLDYHYTAWETPESYSWTTCDPLNVKYPATQRHVVRCPYGQPGDRLWVRESCFHWGRWWKDGFTKSGRQRWRFRKEGPGAVVFDRSHAQVADKTTARETCMFWRRPSIHMPRWASRMTLEITEVRVQRLQSLSEVDAIAEGIERLGEFPNITPWRNYAVRQPAGARNFSTPLRSYVSLWEAIHGPGSWEANPWVWAVSFKLLAP